MLDARELATVLAGLRSLQLHTSERSRKSKYHGHFLNCAPLSDTEIDELCERLNLGQVRELRAVP